MASKFGVFGCLTCGEYIRGTMNDSIEQFEIHMCCDTKPEEKIEKFMKLREVLDAEIAKITQAPVPAPPKSCFGKQPTPPTPPPPPPQPASLTAPKGSLKDQLGEVKLKKVLSTKQPKKLELNQEFNFTHKFGNENAPNMLNVHGQLQDELNAVLLKKRSKHQHHPYKRQ